jgi:hypothetical protein
LAGLTVPDGGDAALDFLTYLSGPHASLEIVFESAWGGGPTRQTHLDLNNRSGWYNYGLTDAQTNRMLLALAETANPTLANPVYCLRMPNEREYRHVLVEELRQALSGAKEPDKALHDAARRWNDVGGAAGRQQRVRDYRLSLGLN